LNTAEKQGVKLRITSGLRTYAEQNELYAKGRTSSGSVVTNAKGGQSNHNFGLAFDVVPIVNGKATYNYDWDRIGRIGKSVGLSWGGDWASFKDRPHFEYLFGKKTSELKALYESGNRDGEYVRI
jgi:peptidoglycan L-alanyl-D-glutamate endopeptidase CwlK